MTYIVILICTLFITLTLSYTLDPKNEYYCYDLNRFNYIPQNTNKELIIEAMNIIIEQNNEINRTTCFNTSNLYSNGDPYMEIFFQDHDNNFQYIYSTSNSVDSLSVVTRDQINSSYLPSDVLYNDDRFYMWDTTILASVASPTDEYPSLLYIPMANSNIKQRLDLKAKIDVGNQPLYTEISVERNTIYIYYPSSIIYCLIDSIQKKIYVMQSGTNQVLFPYSGINRIMSHPLSPETMPSLSKYLKLPNGFVFTNIQLSDNSTLIVYSSPKQNAIIIQDNVRNTYQYLDKNFGKFLYDVLNI